MMALLSVISGVILFLLVRHYAGKVAGYSFVGTYVGSWYLLMHLRRAMSEAPLLFFTTLALLRAARAITVAPRRLGRAVAWLLLMGVCAGLAGAAKLNGLALGFAAAVLCFVVAFRYRGRDVKRWRVAFLAALLVTAITAGVFILVNPFLYVAILVVGAVTALPPLLPPLDWDRYYMYPVLFVSVSVAISLGWIARHWRQLVALCTDP